MESASGNDVRVPGGVQVNAGVLTDGGSEQPNRVTSTGFERSFSVASRPPN